MKIGLLHPGEMGAAVGGGLADRRAHRPVGVDRAQRGDRRAGGGGRSRGRRHRRGARPAQRRDPFACARRTQPSTSPARWLALQASMSMRTRSRRRPRGRSRLSSAATSTAASSDRRRATPGTTRLYLSGAEAATVAGLFAGTIVDARVVSADPSAASAVKMAYAAWTKGTCGPPARGSRVARAEGVEQTLLDEWRTSLPQLPGAVRLGRPLGARQGLALGRRDGRDRRDVRCGGSARRLPPRGGRDLPAIAARGRTATTTSSASCRRCAPSAGIADARVAAAGAAGPAPFVPDRGGPDRHRCDPAAPGRRRRPSSMRRDLPRRVRRRPSRRLRVLEVRRRDDRHPPPGRRSRRSFGEASARNSSAPFSRPKPRRGGGSCRPALRTSPRRRCTRAKASPRSASAWSARECASRSSSGLNEAADAARARASRARGGARGLAQARGRARARRVQVARRAAGARGFRERGADAVVTASTGNHGAATAWAAARLGLSAFVFAPLGASPTKLAHIERLGGTFVSRRRSGRGQGRGALVRGGAGCRSSRTGPSRRSTRVTRRSADEIVDQSPRAAGGGRRSGRERRAARGHRPRARATAHRDALHRRGGEGGAGDGASWARGGPSSATGARPSPTASRRESPPACGRRAGRRRSTACSRCPSASSRGRSPRSRPPESAPRAPRPRRSPRFPARGRRGPDRPLVTGRNIDDELLARCVERPESLPD